MSRRSKGKREILTEREDGLWEPEWTSEFHGWTVNFVRKNLWKVQPGLDFDDLFQEFAFKFAYCIQAYPHVIEAKHFMALYKRACYTHLLDLAGANTAYKKELPTSSIFTKDGGFVDVQGDIDIDILPLELEEALPEAPESVQKIIRKTLKGEGGPVPLPEGGRETCDQRLSRLAELKETRPLRSLVISWVSATLG